MLPGEAPKTCAVREVLEETRLTVKELEQVATVHFYKYDRRVSPDWTVSVFLSRSFEGIPTSGREGIVSWFNVNGLPFDEMWEDDQYWVKLALEGRKLEGWFYYLGDFRKLKDHVLKEGTNNLLSPV